jgi:glycosyltransferase involved in cell wall biosynthesis
MKIAHVTLYPPKNEKHVSSSGVASYSKNLITNMANDDEQIVIANIINEPEEYTEGSVAVRRVFKRNPSFIFSIHKELKKIEPDTIHIQQELALFGGIATAYLLQWLVFLWRKKVTITLHGVIDPNKVDAAFVKENNSKLPVWLVRLAFRVIYTPLMKWSHRIIVHEELFKSITVRSYGIDPRKISVIPHGVEELTTVDQKEARAVLNIPQHAKVALFMGYATGYKGLDLLIEGFARYAKDVSDAYLIIGAGKHPKLHDNAEYLREYGRLKDKAKKLIPEDQYRWEGFIKESEITVYYSASDVSLYPYTTALSSSGPMSFAIGYEKPFLASTAFEPIFSTYPQLLFDRKPIDLAERLEYFFTYKHDYDQISYQLKQQRNWKRVAQLTLNTYRQNDNQEGHYEAEESTTTG